MAGGWNGNAMEPCLQHHLLIADHLAAAVGNGNLDLSNWAAEIEQQFMVVAAVDQDQQLGDLFVKLQRQSRVERGQ